LNWGRKGIRVCTAFAGDFPRQRLNKSAIATDRGCQQQLKTRPACPAIFFREDEMSSEVTRDKLVTDMKTVIADAEELLKATASHAGDKAAAARLKIQESIDVAKGKLTELGEVGVDKAKAAARATDDFVHDNPWQAVGIAAAAGVVLGLLISRR
jgi:ElaB/YqjD/DUF883 family membrane-anchored ribosome-binding protein